MEDKMYIPADIMRLMELGKQKKLWSLELVYNLNLPGGGVETKRDWKRNMDDQELMKFREAVFRYGFSIPVEPGHWKIICPMDIVSMEIYKQDNYVPEKPGRVIG